MRFRFFIFAFLSSVAILGCEGAATSRGLTPSSWDDYVAGQALRPAQSAGDATPLSETPTLQECVVYAALNSPRLRAAFHQWQAALARVPQVRSLQDPTFTYAYYFKEVETRVGPQRQSFSVAQKFPWIGKLTGRGDAASQRALAAWHRFEGEKLTLYARVKKAYCEYYYLGRAAAVTRDNVSLLTQLEELMRTRYRASEADHPDVIRIQVELAKTQDRAAALDQLAAPLLAALNAELGRPAFAPMTHPASIPYDPVAVDSAQLQRIMEQRSPALAAMDRDVAAAERDASLARMEYIPDVTLAATYIDTDTRAGASVPDDGKDPIIGMVTVNVPVWWERLAAGVAEAEHRHQAASHQREQAQQDLSAQLQRGLYELQDAERRINLYDRTLLPKAREALRVTQKGFIGGTQSFNDLIDTQRVWLEFELQYHRSLTDHAIGRAVVEQVIGQPLDVDLSDSGETRIE